MVVARTPVAADSERLPPSSTTASVSPQVLQEPAQAPSQPATPTPKAKRVRSGALKESNVLEWTASMVGDLMRLRYDTFVARFGSAKNNAAIRAAWLLLASEMSRLHSKAVSTEQCKNKIKWLKRKWAEYNSDMRATGNAETPVVEPPGLALMMEYWVSSWGMNGQALADSEGDGSAFATDVAAESNDESVADDTSATPTTQSKKSKTMADSFEVGMKSMADSFTAMAAAMALPVRTAASGDLVGIIDQRFEALMQRQDAQLAQMQMQTQCMVQLIAKSGDNNDKQQGCVCY